MPTRQGLSRLFQRASRWTLVRETGDAHGSRILVGAPHTSNWDFVFMLTIAWDAQMRVAWLGKHQLFRAPFGRLMRALGGIAVDRGDPSKVVEQVSELARAPGFALVVTPEGTRSKAEHWRSGFYRIALQAGMPVSLGYVDRSTMTYGIGPTLTLTGDVHADMEWIREFYRGKQGVRPGYETEPRLRSEPSAFDPDGA